MNRLFKSVVYLLFFLLFIVAGQADYTPDAPISRPISSAPSYRQTQNPCRRTVDHLFTNRFADLPQMVISIDNPDHYKFKCMLRILAAWKEHQKQELQTTHIDYHSYYTCYTDAVDYYVYALRRIVI